MTLKSGPTLNPNKKGFKDRALLLFFILIIRFINFIYEVVLFISFIILLLPMLCSNKMMFKFKFLLERGKL